MASLSLRHIYKNYPGNINAVDDFNLEIDDKEFIVFVGPSGCGKSTTLRMIAGLEDITKGELYIDGRLVNNVPPKDRDIAMVFQNYALYPHMSVYENMAFGLRIRKVKSSEIDKRVREAAELLHIEQLLDRKPKALSGGQRQRVALGRALVRCPKVFLLDEPLSNLDAKLRVAMRTEITKLHNQIGTTFIYVTHDQVEAMTMGTRIVVMKDGVVQQVDSPQNLYDEPVNLFVGTFIGTPQMNILKVKLEYNEAELCCKFGINSIVIPSHKAKKLVSNEYIGQEVLLGIRPEDIKENSSDSNSNITAVIDSVEKLGNETILYLKVDSCDDLIIARVDSRTVLKSGESVVLCIDSNHILLFDKDTELNIMSIPIFNLIENVGVSINNHNVTLSLSNNIIEFDLDIIERFVSRDYLTEPVTVGIKPNDFITQKEFDSLDDVTKSNYSFIKLNIEFVEYYYAYDVLYCRFEGNDGYIVAKVKKNEVSCDNIIKLYFDKFKIMLYDNTNADKILLKRPIKDNKINVKLQPFGKSLLKAKFGSKVKSSILFSYELDEMAADNILIIDKYKVLISNFSDDIKRVVKAKVIDIDILGSKTVIYLNVDGCNGDFVVIADGVHSFEIGSKIKIAFPQDAIFIMSTKEKIDSMQAHTSNDMQEDTSMCDEQAEASDLINH